MRIMFNKLHIHHFLSFDDATIDLSDKGFCLIEGINSNPKDASSSNGSGKSTISNALSWCLLGETLTGLKSGLANNHFNDGCQVTIEFTIDDIPYRITRSKDDPSLGTNLRIEVNGEDRSGKTLTDGKLILEQLLPDVTKELLGGVILLGQGLPDRFTSNTPSKRKEILEHLTKSDFMIQDLKDRIDSRISSMNSKKRKDADDKIELTAQCRAYSDSLAEWESRLQRLEGTDIKANLDKAHKNFDELTKAYTETKSKHDGLTAEMETLKEDYSRYVADARKKIMDEQMAIMESLSSERGKKAELDSKMRTLKSSISKTEGLPDICPLCGQPISEHSKSKAIEESRKVAEELEPEIKTIETKIASLDKSLQDAKEAYDRIGKDQTLLDEYNKKKQIRDSIGLSDLSSRLDTASMAVTRLEAEMRNHEESILDCKSHIQSIGKTLSISNENIERLSKSVEETDKHLAVLSKMSTYAKRDFRGVLLKNSIDYLNLKSKEYAKKIFSTDEVSFNLNGNDIDITYCGKDYEALSGGEKQRMDLIVQFAIRNLLSHRYGFSSNILFLDEITDNLDKKSCDKVIDFITSELVDTDSVFIITHHKDLGIPYDSRIVVSKDAEGISNIL